MSFWYKYLTQSTIVLKTEYYSTFIDLIKKKDFEAMFIFGKVSPSREDAARCMIKIMGPGYKEFVKTCIKAEIEDSPDGRTLFRGNSMASKALDLYMKLVGTSYLRQTIESVLKAIISSAQSFEVDPLRIDQKPVDSKKKKDSTTLTLEDQLALNAKNLTEYNSVVANAIFNSSTKMPKELIEVFSVISETVNKNFPGNATVKYTAVSGFLFLRFFAPAILGPPLFGLRVGVLDALNNRKLLLIAKTLQNLSNLCEFGMKEPFMGPMNKFINDNMAALKEFIDKVTVSIFNCRSPHHSIPLPKSSATAKMP